MDVRQLVFEGGVALPTLGSVVACEGSVLPFSVVIDGAEVEPVAAYLASLVVSDVSPLTVRSYAHDLLRWWRVLSAVGVAWDRATRDDVELLVGWMRTAANPQRRRSDASAAQPGSVNLRTGKPVLAGGYASSTINHALTVVSGFYEFHHLYGRGPVTNPVPITANRHRLLGHRSLMAPIPRIPRAPLRQKPAHRLPRSIPDALWNELFDWMVHDRDRALLALYVSSGARASELLGVTGNRVDWDHQRFWVVSKGTRTLDPLPGSPEAFVFLGRYFDQAGTPGPEEPIWRTLRGQPRPLSYWAMRRILQRANDVLGTNWTAHDLRHTAATRMANDPRLTLTEVQTVLRHRHVSSTELYVQPRIEEIHDKLQEHFARPAPQRTFTAGYAADDIATVFGG
ncbi:site-specific integrase [Gordonia jinhuaensis]|uniref:Integrase n=1 Tax=Gordonia jinhuaensis TaxID=1517702 RepID=A0A916WU96_9ACTN|nr:tyrosine-type recombinase/integrase [Gordonia jinhuaensis]GGB33271.1 integrase [Gordonia jinhuaensis]